MAPTTPMILVVLQPHLHKILLKMSMGSRNRLISWLWQASKNMSWASFALKRNSLISYISLKIPGSVTVLNIWLKVNIDLIFPADIFQTQLSSNTVAINIHTYKYAVQDTRCADKFQTLPMPIHFRHKWTLIAKKTHLTCSILLMYEQCFSVTPPLSTRAQVDMRYTSGCKGSKHTQKTWVGT